MCKPQSPAPHSVYGRVPGPGPVFNCGPVSGLFSGPGLIPGPIPVQVPAPVSGLVLGLVPVLVPGHRGRSGLHVDRWCPMHCDRKSNLCWWAGTDLLIM